MNIFVPHRKARLNAEILDDLRLNKMILESAQMLCSVLHKHNVADIPYAKAHANHPCTLWAGETQGNYQYLLQLGYHMCNERMYRRPASPNHKCEGVLDFCFRHRHVIPAGAMTPFANCTMYKDHPTHEAYRMQLTDKWNSDIKPPKWTRRGAPDFYRKGIVT